MAKYITSMIIAALLLAGCTDTERAKLGAYGESGRIICYSGGQKVVDDLSTGRVQKEDSGGDGYGWVSRGDGLLHESNADCVVVHGVKS